jgi:hypothetical protein
VKSVLVYYVDYLSTFRLHEQDTQCTCNIALRCVCAAIVAVKKQEVLHIVGECL